MKLALFLVDSCYLKDVDKSEYMDVINKFHQHDNESHEYMFFDESSGIIDSVN